MLGSAVWGRPKRPLFLRLARAIWWIGARGCKLLWTAFCDDYIAYTKPALVANTDNTITLLFRLLGWIFAEAGDKCMPFLSACDALGVTVDLTDSHKGLASINNTPAGTRTVRRPHGGHFFRTFDVKGSAKITWAYAVRCPNLWQNWAPMLKGLLKFFRRV